jgi:hypothetical protein
MGWDIFSLRQHEPDNFEAVCFEQRLRFRLGDGAPERNDVDYFTRAGMSRHHYYVSSLIIASRAIASSRDVKGLRHSDPHSFGPNKERLCVSGRAELPDGALKELQPPVEVFAAETVDEAMALNRATREPPGVKDCRRPEVRHPIEMSIPVLDVVIEHRAEPVIEECSLVKLHDHRSNLFFG